ncbi:MAG: hydantoinase B/oxoprolinase family protein, partial [Armatimonadota bacterium]
NIAIGGLDPRRCEPFAYYETVAGGMGARPGADGLSGVQCHMTNTLNTPVEALEHAYPLRVRRYELRRGSGGAGAYRGGDGLIREIEALSAAELSLLSDRRRTRPYGLAGGAPAEAGRNVLVRNGRETELPGKCNLKLEAGDVVRVATPGGGGHGSPRPRR